MQNTFGYGRERIHCVDEDNVAFSCGRGVQIVNVRTGKQKYFWPDNFVDKEEERKLECSQQDENPDVPTQFKLSNNSSEDNQNGNNSEPPNANTSSFSKSGLLKDYNTAGISTIAFHPRRKLVVLGEKNMNPKVFIFSYDEDHTCSFESIIFGATTIEFSDIAFSRDGDWIVLLGAAPDHTLSVWDWVSKKRVVSIKAAIHSLSVSFNPRNRKQLCTTGGGHIAFWLIDESYNGYTIFPIDAHLNDIHNQPIFTKSDVFTHTWGLNEEVFCGSRSKFIKFPTIMSKGEILPTDGEQIFSLVVTKNHIVGGANNGRLNFYTKDGSDLIKDITINNARGADVKTLAVMTDFSTFVVGTDNGRLLSIEVEDYVNSNATEESIVSCKFSTKLLNDSHCGIITGIEHFESTKAKYIISCGSDGTIRFWDYLNNVLLTTMKFDATFTSMACFARFNVIFVGSSSGTVFAIKIPNEITSSSSPSVIFTKCFVTESPILHIKFAIDNINDSILVAASYECGHIAFGKFSQSTEKITPYGLLQLPQQYSTIVNNICWQNTSKLFVSVGYSGDLIELVAPSTPNDQLLKFESHQENIFKLDSPAYAFAFITPQKNGIHSFYTLAQDKSTKLYKLSSEPDMNEMMISDSYNANEEIESHLKSGYAIALSKDGKYLATGAHDGIIWIRKTNISLKCDDNSSSSFQGLHDPTLGGISHVCFSHDSKFVFSGGFDQCVFMYAVDNVTVESKEFSSLEINIDIDNCKDIISERHGVQKSATGTNSHKENRIDTSIISGLEILRKQYQDILAENNEAPVEEQLCMNEFVIDEEYKMELEKEIDLKIAETKRGVVFNNLKKEVLRQRLIKECWDTMHDHQTVLRAFHFCEAIPENRGLMVYNYVIRKQDINQEVLSKKIKFMRRVEEACALKVRRRKTITRALEGGIEMDDNEDELTHPQPNNQAQISEKQLEELEEIDSLLGSTVTHNSDVQVELLYHSMDLFTTQRKITQIHLLGSTIRELRGEFNKRFKEKHIQKEKTIRKIGQINEKIVEILQELYQHQAIVAERNQKEQEEEYDALATLFLQIQNNSITMDYQPQFPLQLAEEMQESQRTQHQNITEESLMKSKDRESPKHSTLKPPDSSQLYHPVMLPFETADSILSVNDKDIQVEKYISNEEKARMKREKELEEERMRKDSGGESAERALQQMMSNVLINPNEKQLVTELERARKPDCLLFGKPKEMFNENDKKQIKEYQSKLKQREEDEIKKQKQLEVRLVNAKQEVKEACDSFDASLKELLKDRLLNDQQVFELELELIKLAQSIFQQEDNEIQEKKFTQILEELKNKKAASASELQSYKKVLETKKIELEQIIGDDKALEKNFRTKFGQECTQDQVERLWKLFRSRPKMKQVNEAEIISKCDTCPDPFADIELREALKNAPVHDPVDKGRDRFFSTQGKQGLIPLVNESIWDQFWEYRQQKIQSDKNLRMLQSQVDEFQVKHDQFVVEDNELEKEMRKTMIELNEFRDKLIRESFNLDKMFKLKQGLIEVEQQAVITDYGNSILISKSVIEDQNKNINQHGAEKIKLMRKIKLIERQINFSIWENELKQFDAKDLHIKHRRLQMLRVTKEMQQFIKNAGRRHHQKEEERKRLIDLTEYTKKMMQERIKEKQKIVSKYSQLSKGKLKENTELRDQIYVMENLVDERKHIASMQSQQNDRNRVNLRMQEMRTEGRLKDLVKAQHAELDFLHTEIERLRERTFPSFAIVQKRKLTVTTKPVGVHSKQSA